MTLHKGHLGQPVVDPDGPFGLDAMSLAYQLSRTSYALAGQPLPVYSRNQIPCGFVRRAPR